MIYAKLGALLAVILLTAFLTHRLDDVAALKARNAEIAAQLKATQDDLTKAQAQAKTDNASEATYVHDIQNPPPLVIKQPVWLSKPTLCPVPNATPSGRPTEPPATGGTDTGPSLDSLQAFAAKYEAALAGCREGARDWPK